MSVIIFNQQTDPPAKLLSPFKLKAATDRDFRAPFVFFPVLQSQSRDEPG
jgi:hypothetical protein